MSLSTITPIKRGEEYLQRIADAIEAGSSELPNYGSGDAGKVLTVASGGSSVEWDEVEALPSYAAADSGKVLGLSGDPVAPAWVDNTYIAEFSEDMTTALLSAANTVVADILTNSKTTPVMTIVEYTNADDLDVLHDTGLAFEAGKRCLVKLTLGGNSMLATATHAESTESAGLVDAIVPVYPQQVTNSVYYFTVGAYVSSALVGDVRKVSVHLWLQLLGSPTV